MAGENQLYIMLSRTDTGMGRLIRFFTRYDYNHVSLSLDPQLRSWVSFARYAVDVPLAGGFVREPAERFHLRGQAVPVRVFRVDLPGERYDKLPALFSLAGNRESGLIYNSLSALCSVFGGHWDIPGAYTCLDFACAVLGRRYSTIRALDRALEPKLYFAGDLRDVAPDNGSREDPYFRPRGFSQGIRDTLGHFRRLLSRAVHPGAPDPLWEILET